MVKVITVVAVDVDQIMPAESGD
ncbi:hypothetical protein RS9916_36952 [Synechococcus sp. RS9916]|nr:hypothetical protein RS9916_36952 [Synechococcus sp. RS9916]